MQRRQWFVALVAIVFSMVVTVAKADPPNAPVLSSVSLGWMNGSIAISSIDPSDSYTVYYKQSSSGTWLLLHSNTSLNPGPSMYVGGLAQLTAYDFRMTSTIGGVESDPSNVVSGTTARKPRI